jgi:two-component system NtrC family sensor kinase
MTDGEKVAPESLDWIFPSLFRLGAEPVLLCFEREDGTRSASVATRSGTRTLPAEIAGALDPFLEWTSDGHSVPIGPTSLAGVEFPDGGLAVPLRGEKGRVLGCLAAGGTVDEPILLEFAAHVARHREEELARRRLVLSEAQLEAAKRDWERTFDAIRDGILLLDNRGVVVRVNRAMKEWVGRDYAGIVGRSVEYVLGGSGAELVRRILEGSNVSGAAAIPGLEGRFEVSAWYRYGPDSNPEGSVVVVADVTEKERLREQLLHAEKLSELGELISGIAHELNNPLTAVLGYAQILELKTEGKFGKELRHLREESLRASRIVRNLLTFARRGEDRREALSLNEIVRQTIALREYDLRVHNVRVEAKLEPGLPRTLMDPVKLQQVVLNLVNNAEYAIRSAADSGRIRLVTSLEDGRLRLAVEDDGPGVPEKIRRQIFNPFFTTKPVGRGTGLGLSICFGIVRDHDGEILLEESPGGGARFVIDLPVTGNAPLPEPGFELGDSAPPLSLPPVPRSILLVDDEPAIRSLGTEFLEEMGHDVTVAENGEDALARLVDGSFDAVICDLRMPKLGGLELYRKAVGRDPAYRDRFVFMSGDSGQLAEDVASAPVVTKPFDLDQLARALDSL